MIIGVRPELQGGKIESYTRSAMASPKTIPQKRKTAYIAYFNDALQNIQAKQLKKILNR
jgi:hypothetical protein